MTKICMKKIETPLGIMIALADESQLYMLQFEDSLKNLDELSFDQDSTPPLVSIEKELTAYFKKTLQEFKTPLLFSGSPFQQKVWNALRKIPYGKTKSYGELAASIGKPTAYRAVANANGANYFCIVVPCHRVIASDGKLGGYSSGLHRKVWLLEHEGS